MNWATNRFAGWSYSSSGVPICSIGLCDDDAVGHRHRLDLVVGDVDGLSSGAGAALISARIATRSLASRLRAARRTGTPSGRGRSPALWRFCAARRKLARIALGKAEVEDLAAWATRSFVSAGSALRS
jgi:hypothetical protein